jgi:hypothetical protein
MSLIQFVFMMLPCIGIAAYGFSSVFFYKKYEKRKNLVLLISTIALILAIGALVMPALSANIYLAIIYFSCLAFAIIFTIIPFLYREKVYAAYMGKAKSFNTRRKTRYRLVFIYSEDRESEIEAFDTGLEVDETIAGSYEGAAELPLSYELLTDDTYTEKQILHRFKEGEEYPVWIRPGLYKKCRIDRFADFGIGLISLIVLVLLLISVIWGKFI